MTTHDQTVPGHADDSTTSYSELRTQRGVRFSDSEWHLVKNAVIAAKISAAEFVRSATMGAVAAPAAGDPDTFAPAVLKLIKHTYRAAYILGKLKRDELVRDGHGEELEAMVDMAKVAQNSIMEVSPA